MKMNPVVHFEMPYIDRNRMAEFYAKSFGWKAQMFGPEMGEYVVAITSEAGEDGRRPKNPGMINGGFYKKTEDELGQCPSVVISVDDINEAVKKIKLAGGKVLGDPMEIPGVGVYASFQDTEGNRVGFLQPLQEM